MAELADILAGLDRRRERQFEEPRKDILGSGGDPLRIGLFNPDDDPFSLVLNEGRTQFNALTGALEIVNPESGLSDFRFDPSKNLTTFGGQTFVGRFDPNILATLTDEDFETAATKFEKEISERETELEKSPFGQAADQQSAIAGNIFNAKIFSEAFKQARGRFEGPDTFEQLNSSSSFVILSPLWFWIFGFYC